MLVDDERFAHSRARALAERNYGDAAIRLAITEGRTPGGVFWLEHGGTVYRKAYGHRALEPQPEPISEDTIYDAASLTKVMATTPSVMKLVEQGKIDLDAPVSKYLPEFAGGAKDKVTVRNLMTHTSATASGGARARSLK